MVSELTIVILGDLSHRTPRMECWEMTRNVFVNGSVPTCRRRSSSMPTRTNVRAPASGPVARVSTTRLSMVVDGMPSGMLLFFLAVELIVGTVGLLLLNRERRTGQV